MGMDPGDDVDHRAATDADLATRLHDFAHAIRNRLAGMREALVQVAEPDMQGSRQELVRFGEQQFFKALREVEQLMDDLGEDREPKGVRSEAVHLGGAVKQVIADLDHRIARKEQEVHLDLRPQVTVRGDAEYLMRILSALISNASKFTQHQGRIDVKLEIEGGQAVCTVRDTGVGLAAQDLEQVFVRYAWLGNAPTDGEAQGRGTLGKAKLWAELQNGSLTAFSAGPGKGATFTLRLPLA